ncbi:MAG: aldehyde dehydrogenase [Deltaproteobacteria bacterium]|nr:aldehyde dehydrogenase [Deltaproteobacteria bacterium]
MRYAETGFNLEIDLTRGNIEKMATDPRDTELYLGGLGTDAKIMWDRVPPEVDAFSPENLLIFSAGLLCGTPAIGANRTTVSAISPTSDLFGFSVMGSYWAPELKQAGYDNVIIRGKASDLVYLWIHDNKVEIRDASHLKGKGAVETQTIIQKELVDPRIQVAAIGLAGENRVYYASIEHDGASASRNGLGAVMGDKKLKAIAVRGTQQDIHIARPAEFMAIQQEVRDYMQFRLDNPIPETPPINESVGIPKMMSVHDEKWHCDIAMWGVPPKYKRGYWTPEVEKEWTETLLSMRTRLIGCYNCPLQCKAVISPPNQPPYMAKCWTKMGYAVWGDLSLEFSLKFGQICTEHGVDAMTTPRIMNFALHLLYDGVLTDDDFPGMPPDMEGRFHYLLEKIVHREGIGDILADGLYRAAQKIGKAAEKYAWDLTKKTDQVAAPVPFLNPVYFLMCSTGAKLDVRMMQGQVPQHPFSSKEVREGFVKDWFQVPDEKFKQYYVDWQRRREGPNHNPEYPTPQIASEWVDWMERMHYIDDCLGICAGLSSWPQKPPYHLHNFPQVITTATGIEFDREKLSLTTKRIRSLIRAINNRRGMRRKDDKAPSMWKERNPELEKELIDVFYKLKGWNMDGVPTKESLDELGLGFVSDEFIKRGILA